MAMTLVQLSAMLAAARYGSFSSAAAHLGMTQPAISDLIRRLERDLDVPLFERLPQGLQLTQAGRELYPHAEQAIRSAAEGAHAVESLHALTGGHATFGLFKNADHYLGADLPTRFKRSYPGVRLRFIAVGSPEAATAVRTGDVEAGLVALPVDDSDLGVLPVGRDEVLYLSSANAPPPEQSISILAACERPLILYDAFQGNNDPTRRQLAVRAQLAGAAFQPDIEVESSQTAIQLVRDGFGSTIINRGVARDLGLDDSLTAVPFAEPLYDTFAFIRRRDRTLSSAAREMVRLAFEALTERAPELHVTVTERELIDFLT